jgi:DNA-binding NarL/FixJ family response regulator
VSKRILIVDDYTEARQATRHLLAEHSDWVICGEAENGLEAVEKAGTLKPDIVILDLSMPKMNGLEAANIIHTANPDLPLLLFSVDGGDPGMLAGIRAAGFRGAVSKSKGWLLSDAIEMLLQGKTFFDGNGSALAAPAAEAKAVAETAPQPQPANTPQNAKKAVAGADDAGEPSIA